MCPLFNKCLPEMLILMQSVMLSCCYIFMNLVNLTALCHFLFSATERRLLIHFEVVFRRYVYQRNQTRRYNGKTESSWCKTYFKSTWRQKLCLYIHVKGPFRPLLDGLNGPFQVVPFWILNGSLLSMAHLDCFY